MRFYHRDPRLHMEGWDDWECPLPGRWEEICWNCPRCQSYLRMYHRHLGRNRSCSSSKESYRVLGEDRANGREDEAKTKAKPHKEEWGREIQSPKRENRDRTERRWWKREPPKIARNMAKSLGTAVLSSSI